MKRSYYTFYREKKHDHIKILKIISIILLFAFAMQGIKYFVIDIYSIKTVSMNPALNSGKRAVVSPLAYGIKNPFSSLANDFIKSPQRGDIVLIISPQISLESAGSRFLDQALRFFTMQKISFLYKNSAEWGSPFQFKRVIGLPGETVYISAYEAFIGQSGNGNFVSENALITKEYDLAEVPAADKKAPLNADMEAVTLAENEYFLLGDNRAFSLDSRTFGPVARNRIIAKYLFSF